MKLCNIKTIFLLMIIIIITLSSVCLLFIYEDIFLDDEYKKLISEINISNNESVVKCINGSYQIVSPYNFYICGELNSNIRLKKESI